MGGPSSWARWALPAWLATPCEVAGLGLTVKVCIGPWPCASTSSSPAAGFTGGMWAERDFLLMVPLPCLVFLDPTQHSDPLDHLQSHPSREKELLPQSFIPIESGLRDWTRVCVTAVSICSEPSGRGLSASPLTALGIIGEACCSKEGVSVTFFLG